MILDDLVDWMKTFALQYGYVGIFLISLLGATSVFVPIPSTVVIFILGGLKIGGETDRGAQRPAGQMTLLVQMPVQDIHPRADEALQTRFDHTCILA